MAPQSLNFKDANTDQGSIFGVVSVIRASSEDDISFYELFLSDTIDTLEKFIYRWPLPKKTETYSDSQVLVYQLVNTIIETEEMYLIVCSANAHGRNKQFLSLKIKDLYG